MDFDGFRALQPLFDAAKEAGIWIVMRPGDRMQSMPFSLTHKDCLIGPYINAETTAGGVALWATSTIAGELRTNDTGVRESWELCSNGIINEVRHH